MAVSSKDISQERTPVADYRAPQAAAAKLTPEPVDVTDGHPAQSEKGATLRTIVELVRRTMHADTTSVVSFSLADKTITWQAASGFHSYPVDEQNKLVRPINNAIALRAVAAAEIMIFEGLGVCKELPANDFPIHVAEGVRDLVLAPLRPRGETLGALIIGYRSAHRFTAQEKELLEGLSEMAELVLDNERLLRTVSAGKRMWEQTFDSIKCGIVVHDGSDRILRCNEFAAAMLNLMPAQAIGLSWVAAFARLFGERSVVHLPDTSGEASWFELQADDGRRYLLSVSPLDTHRSKRGSVIIWNDVTEISEMQEQLSRSRRLVTVGRLAAGVAHEINNPLASITACAEATLRDMRQSAESASLAEEDEWAFHLEEIVRQALRCKSITQGLLDLSSQRSPNRSICDLNLLAVECLQQAGRHPAKDRISFEKDLDANLGEIAIDAVMVRQILDNLLNNAIDSLGDHGGEIKLTTVRGGARVAIEVADTGAGIALDQLARIFDPFFTTKDPGKGSGLGLAVSSALAENLGGKLTVESRLGAGSKFRLWLPRRAPQKQQPVK